MIGQVLKYFGIFFGLTLFQALALNHVHISFFINPFIYPVFLIWLPFGIPSWLLLVIGFFTGLTQDFFTDSPGIHASACTLLAFLRPFIIRMLTQTYNIQPNDVPGIRLFGFTWFLTLTLILIFSHHLLYFFLEIFSFKTFFETLAKVLLSSFFSVLLIILLDLIFSQSVDKR